MRLAIDTGGTFTDLVLEQGSERRLLKTPTTPHDPIEGVLAVLGVAAEGLGRSLRGLLEESTLLVHGTTRAVNAVLTGEVARTALLTTRGHRDILLFREGGRADPFDYRAHYPNPYIPRSLTFEVPERVTASGEVVEPLVEDEVLRIAPKLERLNVEAVAVCLLWSIVNPVHELRVGELLAQRLPDLPVTLSHKLNPTIREYRRASSAAIDASLKPLMSDYLWRLEEELRANGFGGRLLVVTSAGGMLDARAIAESPIHSIKSGPALAPVAGRHYALLETEASNVIVADAGGTSYDVSLVSRGRIPTSTETWLGPPYTGHMTGFPSVDVRSIGAGGGSIAWVDSGGLLRLGPESAGSDPGPVCYGRGGGRVTMTDAALVAGYLDPDYFLGGAMSLDQELARAAIADAIARPLGLDVREAAAAIVSLATEHMVAAIESITVNQGIDPRRAVLVAGGGAAGLNAVSVARRLGCAMLIIPDACAGLSAAGALLADLTADHVALRFSSSSDFEFAAVNRVLTELHESCRAFIGTYGADFPESGIEFTAEVRYPQQVWQLDVPLHTGVFRSNADVERLRRDFNDIHAAKFGVSDPESAVEIIAWRARARCRLTPAGPSRVTTGMSADTMAGRRSAYFQELGWTDVTITNLDQFEPGITLEGPAILESAVTTIVLPSGFWSELSPHGSLLIRPVDSGPTPTRVGARIDATT